MSESLFSSAIMDLKQNWFDISSPIWLASTISLHRNIEKYKFPSKLDIERKKQIVNLVGKEELLLEELQQPKLIKAEELNFLDKEFLVEHLLAMNNFHATEVGEAFLLDGSGRLATLFNLANHLTFYNLITDGDLEGSWSRLVKLETALGSTFSYAASPKFGFLTSQMEECGTALQVSTFLQMPALMHTGRIDEVFEKEADECFSITGLQGSPTEIIGDLFVLRNNYTIGLSEENIISSVRTMTSKLMMEEKAERKQIKQSQNSGIIDRVSRAFGILVYSYQIEAIEALNAISLCKLGVAMEWISGITEAELNVLFFNCRRAHLFMQYAQKLEQEEIPHKRAEYIHKALKSAKLLV